MFSEKSLYLVFQNIIICLMSIKTIIYQSPCGELLLGEYNNQLCLCDWYYRKNRESIDNRIKKALDAEYIIQESSLLLETKQQLEEYFEKKREVFDLPLLFVGTSFQQEVWNTLQTISYGKTTSYFHLAKLMNNESAVRAVANANGANALAIIIPCHRVIGKNNALVGYAGGLDAKKKLLNLEMKTGLFA